MKRIIFLISAMLMIVSFAKAQTLTVDMNKVTYAVIDANYNATNTTEVWFKFSAPKDFPTTQDFRVELDSLSGNHTNVAVALYGRKFSGDGWTAIGSTVNWKGTTADTTIIISNATANRFREYKVGFTGTGTGVTKIDKQEFKLYLE